MDWDALVNREIVAEYKPTIDDESREDQLIKAENPNPGLTVSIMDEDAKDHIPQAQKEIVKQNKHQFDNF